MKTKYIIGTLVLGIICIFSVIHPERYHIFIPIIFGTLTIFSIVTLITDKKEV